MYYNNHLFQFVLATLTSRATNDRLFCTGHECIMYDTVTLAL